MSLAYGQDYDELSSELNAFKRKKFPEAKYNNVIVFDFFIRNQKGAASWGKPSKFGFDYRLPTVQEFSEKLSSGTYCLLCGKTGDSDSHMVCIIDGDIWDSWNSSNYIVTYVYCIREGTTDFNEDVEWQDLDKPLRTFVSQSLEKFQKKMEWAAFEVDPRLFSTDDYSAQIKVIMFVSDELRRELNIPWLRDHYTKYFDVKINPTWSVQENIEKQKEKIYYHLREWTYANRKEIEDLLNVRNLATHPHFRGDKRLLLKLPKDIQSKITHLEDRGSNDWQDRYYAELEALPDDPRYNPHDSIIIVYGENLRELIYNIKQYYEKYYRVGYDY